MKSLLVALLASLNLFGGNQFFPDVTLTDDIYWAAQQPAVRALRVISSDGERNVKCASLAASGVIIDVPIHCWAWSPVTTMGLRAQYGYTWVPSALQAPPCAAPGITFGGCKPYDPANPPVGSIKVSLDAKDYPAFDPPAPPPNAPSGLPVGPSAGFGNVYFATDAGKLVPDGQEVIQNGVKYKKRITVGLMGPQHFFEKQ